MGINQLDNVKGLKISELNCRSFFKKRAEIMYAFEKVNILGLTETWLDARYDDQFVEWKGTQVLRLDRSNSKGGGVACFIDEDLSAYTSVLDELSTCISEPDLELLSLNIEKPGNRHRIIMVAYRPPNGSINNFIGKIQEVLISPILNNNEIWNIGDFNIDVKNREDAKCKSLYSLCRENGLRVLIHDTTRPNFNGGTSIDNMLTNCEQVAASAWCV